MYNKVHITDITAEIYLQSNTLVSFVIFNAMDLIKTPPEKVTHLATLAEALHKGVRIFE